MAGRVASSSPSLARDGANKHSHIAQRNQPGMEMEEGTGVEGAAEAEDETKTDRVIAGGDVDAARDGGEGRAGGDEAVRGYSRLDTGEMRTNAKQKQRE